MQKKAGTSIISITSLTVGNKQIIFAYTCEQRNIFKLNAEKLMHEAATIGKVIASTSAVAIRITANWYLLTIIAIHLPCPIYQRWTYKRYCSEGLPILIFNFPPLFSFVGTNAALKASIMLNNKPIMHGTVMIPLLLNTAIEYKQEQATRTENI
uniref:Uncharacterized protein n=1 Tax=Glossina brevipalpis TaxID=37001 RepID=A0A1A9W172_9MUSC